MKCSPRSACRPRRDVHPGLEWIQSCEQLICFSTRRSPPENANGKLEPTKPLGASGGAVPPQLSGIGRTGNGSTTGAILGKRLTKSDRLASAEGRRSLRGDFGGERRAKQAGDTGRNQAPFQEKLIAKYEW